MKNIFKKLKRNDIVFFYDQDIKENFNVLITEKEDEYIVGNVDGDNYSLYLKRVDPSLKFINKVNQKRLCRNCLVKMSCNKESIFECANNYFKQKRK